MNEHLQNILSIIQKAGHLSDEEKATISKEAKATDKEFEIEAALEKVRSRTMAMQKSDELLDVIQVVSQQFLNLNIKIGAATFALNYKESNDFDLWLTVPGQPHVGKIHVPYFDHPLFNNFIDAKEKGLDFFVQSLSFEEKNSYFKHFFENTPGSSEEEMNWVYSSKGYAGSEVLMKSISLGIANLEAIPYTEEENAILRRFAAAFEQSYIRFLDLQKAEAQAREAQIDAALERTRTQSMSMQHSEELDDTLRVFHQQVLLLGIHSSFSFLWLPDEDKDRHIFWAAWAEHHSTFFKSKAINYPLDRNEPATAQCLIDWKSDQPVISYHVPPDGVEGYFAAWQELIAGVEQLKPEYFSDGLYYVEAFMKYGCFGVMAATDLTENEKKVLGRFAIEFERTYTRFLDLQKAEEQAREATIEAALEKVRGKAMAMHNSNDLSSAASLIFTELRKLGIMPIRCGVGLLTKESRRAQLYSAVSSEIEDSLALIGWVDLSGHEVLENIYEAWLSNKEYYPELTGEQLKSYYELLLRGLSVKVPNWQSGQKQYGTFLPFTVGCLYAWSEVPYTEAEIKILRRFASIIDLTFRRCLDLQKSEASTREAVKQAALDRVRADIASMRTTADLERITPLIWKELTILGIPFIRCGVFIMDDSQQLIHTFLSTPDGKAIGAFHLPYNTPGSIGNVVTHWENHKSYIDHWDEVAFSEFADILVNQRALPSREEYLKTLPPGGFYLHFLPFLQGMLYVGNTVQLSEQEMSVVQSVADAFSTAYARYEDFNKLEAAKKQVDSALNELQATQKQLIQSEKMASLGELTAGIAHEIQNPLNFVNNFSDVNKELLAELTEEIEKGNYEEVKMIAVDIACNEEKISHHGKRADSIVKGMLQHSRSTSTTKEPTDINSLADEYLRLAYHGLRAKDKSFNATMKTDYDKTIGKINIIPQDIGRVLLNLYNNAFYAVNEKRRSALAKATTDEYEPLVSVSSKKLGDKISISVKDNGNGIPKKVVDKIFQPFFTTKPTGQGTGLGLSLSYDIMKAHSGEIKIETKEGETAEFIIELPIKSNL